MLQLPLLGFTDGDKAVGLALGCGARRLVLAGMEFGGATGWWSKPWLSRSTRPWREKRVKLRFAERIVELLSSLLPGVEVTRLRPGEAGSSRAAVMREYYAEPPGTGGLDGGEDSVLG